MMKMFTIECLEKFVVRTTYNVLAETQGEAIAIIKAGDVAYYKHEIEEGDEEFISAECVAESDAD